MDEGMWAWFNKWARKHPRVAGFLALLMLIGGVVEGIRFLWGFFSGAKTLMDIIDWPLVPFVIAIALIAIGLVLLTKIFRQTKGETPKEHLENIRVNLVKYRMQLQTLANSKSPRRIYSTPIETNRRVMAQLRAHCPKLGSLRGPQLIGRLLYRAGLQNKRSISDKDMIRYRAKMNPNIPEIILAIDTCLVSNEYTRHKCDDCPPEKN